MRKVTNLISRVFPLILGQPFNSFGLGAPGMFPNIPPQAPPPSTGGPSPFMNQGSSFSGPNLNVPMQQEKPLQFNQLNQLPGFNLFSVSFKKIQAP